MRHISPEELVALHDANISRYGGLPGMSDPGRAEAIIGRVQARVAYEEITDLFRSLRHLPGGYSERAYIQ